jgi:hypothetical protein
MAESWDRDVHVVIVVYRIGVESRDYTRFVVPAFCGKERHGKRVATFAFADALNLLRLVKKDRTYVGR